MFRKPIIIKGLIILLTIGVLASLGWVGLKIAEKKAIKSEATKEESQNKREELIREQIEKPKPTEEPLPLKEISLDEVGMDFEEIVKKMFPNRKFIPYKPEVFHQNKKAICLEQIFKDEQNFTGEEYVHLEKILEGSFVETNSKDLFVIIRIGSWHPDSNDSFPANPHVGGFYRSIIGIFDKDTKNFLAKGYFSAYNFGDFIFYNCKKEGKIHFIFREFESQQGWFTTRVYLYKIENKEFKKIEINKEHYELDWLTIEDSKNRLSFFEGVNENFLTLDEFIDKWERKEKIGLISYRLRGNVHLYDYIWNENKCLFEKYDESPNLKTYQNEKYKFAIDFPMDWLWIDDYGIEILLLENLKPECNNLSWQEIINDFSKYSSLSENPNINFIIQKLNFKKEFFSRFNKKGYEIEGNFGVCIKPEVNKNCKERLKKNNETKIKGVLFPLIEEENKKSGALIFYYENILEDKSYFNQIINSFRQY